MPEVRLAVHEQRIEDLEAEQTRTRDRLHTLEQDRIALRLMGQQIQNLAETVKLTAGTVSGVDSKVTDLLLAKAREEGGDATRHDWLSSRRFVVTTLIAASTVIVALISVLATILIHS